MEAMNVQADKIYQLGDILLNASRRELRRGQQKIHLSNKPYQVLLYLVEHRERMVSRNELLEQFWQGKNVYDETLTKCVGAIRKALDDRLDEPRFIETRYGEGYRYIGACAEQVVEEETSPVETEKETIEPATHAPTITLPAASPAPLHPPSAAKLRAQTLLPLGALIFSVAIVAALTINRRQTVATEVAADTEAPASHSIAALPLKNLTGDPANEYLSDGLTDSLISALAKVQGLKVIARSSAFEFKGRDVSAQEIGRRLGVATVLEGSLLKSGDHLRVAVRLVSARDGQVLWVSQADDNAFENTFSVQDEVTRHIVSELRIKLSAERQQRLAQRQTENLAAYEAYLKGRYFLNQRTPEGITKGVEYFQKAIAIDPNYALAYAALAEGYDKSFWFMERHPKELMAKERDAAQKALALDDTLSEAHMAMATVYANTWDLTNAAREEERAIELNPGNAEAHHNYAYRLIDLCRPDEAVAEIKLARELDPLNVVMNVDVGEILLFARRYDEAIEALRDAIEMDPNRANAHMDIAYAYEKKGKHAEAVAEHITSLRLKGESAEATAALREAYATAGMKGFWRKRIEQMKSKRSYIEPVEVANIYTELGELDEAFAWYEKAYQDRSPNLVGLKSSAAVDPLRSDPRYADLLRRVGLP